MYRWENVGNDGNHSPSESISSDNSAGKVSSTGEPKNEVATDDKSDLASDSITLTEAQRRANALRAQRSRRGVAEQQAPDKVSAKTVREVWDLFIADREEDGYDTRPHRWNWKSLEKTFGNLKPENITATLCRKYARERFNEGKAPDTVKTQLARLRTCMHWALNNNAIENSVYVWVCKGSPPRERVATREEFIRMIEACEWPHTRLYLILLLCTGGRSSAIFELTWDRVDFEKRTVDLRQVDVNTDPINKSYKKGRAKVPMNKLLYQELKAAYEVRETDNVLEFDGKPIASARSSYRRTCRLAKVEGVTPHTLRHTGATWAMNNDVSIDKIAKFCGHKNTKTTETVYTHPDPEFAKEVADVVDMELPGPL